HRLQATGLAPSGTQLVTAIREFWRELKIEEQLQDWADSDAQADPASLPVSVHTTVWEQANVWLDNVELGFPTETLPLKDWFPILETGLANLTVGLIPPALDHVLVGAIDRSRNPDIQLGFVLGLNEGVFPALPSRCGLLTDPDRTELEQRGLRAGLSARQHLAREHFLGYIAFTRARKRLVITAASADLDGAPLNPSPFLSRLKSLLPDLKFERFDRPAAWREAEHPNELAVPLLRAS